LPFAVVALVGCESTIDHAKIETNIREELKSKGVTMATLTCPDKIVAKAGGTFQCSGTDDDGTATTFTVTMKDAQGSISWELDGAIIGMAKLGDDMEAKLSASSGKKVDVKCPAKSMIAKTGCKFTCDLTSDGAPGKIDFTCVDDKGGVTGKIE
jgi:hypothetical protein